MMNLVKNVKEGSFLDEYLKYMDNFSTSKEFNFWSGLWILSTLIGRSVLIDRPNNTLFCNLFINFINNNSEINNNLSVNILSNLLYKFNQKYVDSPMVIYEFIKLMLEQSNKNGKVNSIFIIKDYTKSINRKKFYDLLISLYDNPEERSYYEYNYTDKSTCNHYTSLCTFDTFDNYIKTLADGTEITTKQFTIIESESKIKIGWGEEVKEPKKLINRGHQIMRKFDKRRKVILSTEAIGRYNSWFRNRKLTNSFLFRGYENNEADLILKIATLLAINYNINTTEIQSNFIDDAINLVDYHKKVVMRLINSEIDKDNPNDYERIVKRIRNKLIKHQLKGIMHNQLYQSIRNCCSREEFKYIISILHELELIEMYMIEGSKGYYYKITDKFYNIKDLDEITKVMK